MTTTTRSASSAALKLARELRDSVRKRSVDLDAALSRYDETASDLSASEADEAEAAALLMKVVARTDREHAERKADAWGEFAAATKGRGV